MTLWRDLILLWMAVIGASMAEADTLASRGPECQGVLQQGGLMICLGEKDAQFVYNGVRQTVDDTGAVSFGLPRNADALAEIDYLSPDGTPTRIVRQIVPRRDEETVLNGISCDKIDARTDEQKAHAARSWDKKQKAWATFRPSRSGLGGFQAPAEGRVSSPFGFTRRYVTEGCDTKTSPHLGYDIAAPVGAPITAPAGGTVVLADTDLYYEGGTVFLDHGHGLMSIFLHMSAVRVEVGDVLEPGDLIGDIGATGRVTGPHLHWGVKWRNPQSEDRSGDFYIDPALLLEMAALDD